MKKFYNAPAMELEVFETADVITISFNAAAFVIGTDDSAKIATVDVSTLNFQ